MSIFLFSREFQHQHLIYITQTSLITGAHWFVSNRTLYTDLDIKYVAETIRTEAGNNLGLLEHHRNHLVASMISGPRQFERLRRT